MIFQDADHALMTVTLFHKVVDDYKNKVLEILFTNLALAIYCLVFVNRKMGGGNPLILKVEHSR